MVEILGIIAAIITVIAAGYSAYRYAVKRLFPLDMKSSFSAAVEVLEMIERDNWKPTIVIGLGRSGALWGGWMAGNLGSLPIAVIDKKFIETRSGRRVELTDCDNSLRRLKKSVGADMRALVVEGATTSGVVFDVFEASADRAFPGLDFRTASLYVRKGSVRVTDYFSRQMEDPWPDRFPWHYRAAYRRYLHAKEA